MSSENRVNRAEINRLTKAIAAEEQIINAVFQRMGQTYFTAHRHDPEQAQAANVQAVLDAIERAKRYKDQINVLRGIAICPNCKAEISSSAAFCSRCGTKMPVQAPLAAAEANHCPACGNRCAVGIRFCNRCGTRLPEQPGSTQISPAPVSPNPTPSSLIPEPAPTPVIPEPAPTPVIPEPAPTPVIPEPAPTPVIPEPVPTREPQASRFCPNCGTALDPEYRFCMECGSPV